VGGWNRPELNDEAPSLAVERRGTPERRVREHQLTATLNELGDPVARNSRELPQHSVSASRDDSDIRQPSQNISSMSWMSGLSPSRVNIDWDVLTNPSLQTPRKLVEFGRRSGYGSIKVAATICPTQPTTALHKIQSSFLVIILCFPLAALVP
jgi:hypothetical protein